MKLFGITFEKGKKGKWTLPLVKTPSGLTCRTRKCRGTIRDNCSRDSSAARCHKCYSRIYRANNLLKYAFHHVKDSAKKRNINFNLTLEEFENFIDGTGYLENKGITRHCLHIDRIDASKGYELGNLRVCTAAENCAKDNNKWREKIEDDNCPF